MESKHLEKQRKAPENISKKHVNQTVKYRKMELKKCT